MATEARIGYGTILRIATPEAPAVFATIGEVTSVTPPPMTRDIIDATHMASPNRTREFIAGLIDGGEMSCDLNFVPGSISDIRLREMQTETEPSACEIEYPNGTVQSFFAYCTGYEPSDPLDDKMTATATFKVTGTISFEDPT